MDNVEILENLGELAIENHTWKTITLVVDES